MRIVPQWAVAELCGTRAGLSRAPLCSSVLDDRNGRPAHSFRSIRRQRNQAVTKRALNQDSHLPRRVALTRRMSAVRARQHPPKSITCETLGYWCPLWVHLKWRPPALPWLPMFNVGANYSNIIDLIAET